MAEKVCRNCKMFVSGTVCPVCRAANFTRTWKGILYVNDPTDSEVAQLLGIKAPGRYALWVK